MPGRDDLGVLGRAAVEELGDAQLRGGERREKRHHALGVWRRIRRAQRRLWIANYADRREHCLVARQVGPDEHQEQLAQHALERGKHGVVAAVRKLRTRAAEIEHQFVALLLHRQLDLDQAVFTQRAVGHDHRAHLAFRPLAQTTLYFRLRVLEPAAQRRDHGVDAELGDRRLDPLLQPAADEQLDLHILVLELRLAHRVLQVRNEILFQLVVLDHLER